MGGALDAKFKGASLSASCYPRVALRQFCIKDDKTPRNRIPENNCLRIGGKGENFWLTFPITSNNTPATWKR